MRVSVRSNDVGTAQDRPTYAEAGREFTGAFLNLGGLPSRQDTYRLPDSERGIGAYDSVRLPAAPEASDFDDAINKWGMTPCKCR